MDIHRWYLQISWGLKHVMIQISRLWFSAIMNTIQHVAMMEGRSILIIVPSNTHWIGLREHLQEPPPYFMGKSMVSSRFSLKPSLVETPGIGYELPPFRVRLGWGFWWPRSQAKSKSGRWFQPTPLKNDGLRQLGWWHSQYDGSVVQNSMVPVTTNQYISSYSISSYYLWCITYAITLI